ncbi:MAG: 30S ribosomal protein S18 [Verrucomicrobia bacterium]|nr:30S ribosomal protein S18 [Verrucomicrobiota bacterium]
MKSFRPSSSKSFLPNAPMKPKKCPFTADGIWEIDYKDVDTLKQFTTERGKILPRRITGVSQMHQRKLTKAIKQARYMALMPFVAHD